MRGAHRQQEGAGRQEQDHAPRHGWERSVHHTFLSVRVPGGVRTPALEVLESHPVKARARRGHSGGVCREESEPP
jgi:hypothetical protein